MPESGRYDNPSWNKRFRTRTRSSGVALLFPIEQTPTQIDNYAVRPEFFEIRRYSDPIDEPYHGQGTNDPDAVSKSNERLNRGSVRAEGNVNDRKE